MYDGVKAMIEAEKEFGGGYSEKDTKCGRHLKEPGADIGGFPVFPKGQQGSLLCKFLTREVWE